MATDELSRLAEQLPAPCKAVAGDVTMGDRCFVLQQPQQRRMVAEMRQLVQAAAAPADRRFSEGYDSASGTEEYDGDLPARKDSLDSCISSYNSGDLGSASREFAFGFGTGLKCTVEDVETLEERYETVEDDESTKSSERESDSDDEDDGDSCEWALPEDEQDKDSVNDEESTVEVVQALSSLLHRESNQTFESLSVTDSKAVHVGNVTYILGEVKVKQVVQETSLKQQVFVSQEKGGGAQPVLSDLLRIVTRSEWLAQPESEPSLKVHGPLNLVLINHTATEASTTMMTNMMLCRHIQLMHMEGNDWWDIGYNFLVGMDGYVYEGRGWGLVGAHTYGYNSRSVGVAFIGCFMQHVPTPQAVAAFDQLLELGIREGHLTPDCRIVGHCQCAPSESPGRALLSLMKTWPRWAETPPPPPVEVPQSPATAQPRDVAPASSAAKSSLHVITEVPADETNGSSLSDNQADGADKLRSCRPGHEPDPPKAAGKPEDGWDSPRGQSGAEAVVSSGLVEADTPMTDSRIVAIARPEQRDGAGHDEAAFTERFSGKREAISVSGSAGVHLGRVSYTLGPLCVSQVLQKASVERHVTVSRPGRGSELCMVRREEWGARPPEKKVTPLSTPISKVVVCHTETGCGATLEREAKHVLMLQQHAVHGRGVADILYNFLVGASGCVFEGRGWHVAASFARGHNESSLGVAFIGSFKEQPPSREALEAFHQLLALGEREGHLAADWRLLAHCQVVATDSPGRSLYQLVRTWPRWAELSPSDAAGMQDLKLVSRAQWLASPPAEAIPKLECPVRTVIICHTETKDPVSAEAERRQVRSLQDFEVHGHGRADVPYHFLVAPSGAVFEGRGWELAAGLDLPDDQDGRCFVVALLGTFNNHPPAEAALDTLQALLEVAERRGVLAEDYHLLGHCQLDDTRSPGKELFSLLKTWPRWTDEPSSYRALDAEESDTAPVR